MKLERSLFLQCLDSPQRAGLVHAFFAEREAAKAPEARRASARAVERVGVVGGGTMGAGIAVAALDAGLPVTMIERDDASLARGRAHVEKVRRVAPHDAGRTRGARRAPRRQHALRRARAGRRRDRGRVRGHGREAGGVRRACACASPARCSRPTRRISTSTRSPPASTGRPT
jgi:hypothetical protein